MMGAGVATGKAIHVIAASANDWIVREEGGRELGHYPARQEAEAVGRKLAEKRGVEFVVQDVSGKTQRSKPRTGWFARLIGR